MNESMKKYLFENAKAELLYNLSYFLDFKSKHDDLGLIQKIRTLLIEEVGYIYLEQKRIQRNTEEEFRVGD